MKYVKWILAAAYVYFILTMTVIGREQQADYIFKGLFWEIQNSMWSDIAKNIILFVPLGFIIGGLKGIVTGFILSVGVETIQYFGKLGYCEADDVLNNTIGTSIGVCINVIIGKIISVMGLRKWEDLPEFMRCDEVRPYWESLNKKRGQLVLKRIFDFLLAIVLLVILAIPMIIIAILIKLDSKGPVMYRQERVTTYGKHFKIHKFRTMVNDADKIGTAVTVGNDSRITGIGKKLRKLRLDELPQLFDVLEGNMSFVGTRPEAVKYVEVYKSEYNATLLMPAGITSEASIRYKEEDKLLKDADNVDKVYVEQVLPGKMEWNLRSIKEFRFLREIQTIIHTLLAIWVNNNVRR